jgi:hypothetical protein
MGRYSHDDLCRFNRHDLYNTVKAPFAVVLALRFTRKET